MYSQGCFCLYADSWLGLQEYVTKNLAMWLIVWGENIPEIMPEILQVCWSIGKGSEMNYRKNLMVTKMLFHSEKEGSVLIGIVEFVPSL